MVKCLIMFKNYFICGQKFRIEAPDFPTDCADWQLFEAELSEPDISVTCNVVAELPSAQGVPCGSLEDFTISCKGDMVFRQREMAKFPGILTEYNYINGSGCQVYFTPKSFPVFMDERYFWTSVPLSQLLLPKKAIIMHASFIEVNGSAVLFSAPCGTGKSTQAELWRVHRNAEIINGDKAGVYFKDNKVFAGGVPFCGTSKICKNKDLPLKAIVLLSQGKENSVKRLTGLEALQKVVSNIYLELLAPLEKQMCIDFVIELLNKVPVLSLECTPDESAVEELEKFLV